LTVTWLQSLGAEHVILYSQQEVVTEVERITGE
jgi:NADPH:quinone reductase-like Zn-dependent oxidoreductase